MELSAPVRGFAETQHVSDVHVNRLEIAEYCT